MRRCAKQVYHKWKSKVDLLPSVFRIQVKWVGGTWIHVGQKGMNNAKSGKIINFPFFNLLLKIFREIFLPLLNGGGRINSRLCETVLQSDAEGF